VPVLGLQRALDAGLLHGGRADEGRIRNRQEFSLPGAAAFETLLFKIAQATVGYLKAQIARVQRRCNFLIHGARAQLADYETYALPAVREIITRSPERFR